MAIDSLLSPMCSQGGLNKGELQESTAFPEFTYSCDQVSSRGILKGNSVTAATTKTGNVIQNY